MTGNIIIMAKREDPFARIPKSILNNDLLSWKAKGILAYLLGKPAGWKTNVTDLVRHGTDGKSAVWSALKELRKYGFAELVRITGERGRVAEWVWKISDSPIFICPDTDFPDLDCPHLENRHHSKTVTDTKNDGTKKKLLTSEDETANSDELSAQDFSVSKKVSVAVATPPRPARRPPPSPDEDEFDEFLSEHCPGISMKRESPYRECMARGWLDTKGKPIRDWRKYVLALEALITTN